MGKTVQATMGNPMVDRNTSELHALTRLEEETCYNDLKAKALEYCKLPIKGTHFPPKRKETYRYLVFFLYLSLLYFIYFVN